jgi:hypothetical protein
MLQEKNRIHSNELKDLQAQYERKLEDLRKKAKEDL